MDKVEDMIELLSELEEGGLDDIGKMYLKDTNLRLSEYIKESGVEEGNIYGSKTVIVKEGDAFPELYKGWDLKSILTGEICRVKVMEITKVRWHSKNPGTAIVNIIVKSN